MKTVASAALAALSIAAPALGAVLEPSAASSIRMGDTQPAYLYEYPARTDSAEPGRKLMPEDTICPDDKVTIMCKPGGDASYAVFYVDDREARQENVVPYILTGDRSGYAAEWKPSGPGPYTVKCVTDKAEEVSASITIKCDREPNPPPPTPAPSTTKPETTMKPEPATTMRPETTRMPPTTMRATTPRASPAPRPATQPAPPPTAPQTTPRPPTVPPKSGNLCKRIKATDYIGSSLPADWKPKSGGIVYKDGGDGKIDKPPTSDDQVITYEFVADHDGYHAITMESETPDRTEHNDMWIMFPEGIVRRKGAVVKPATTEWLKVYQGTMAKSWRAFTTDHYGDSLSTAIRLKKGEKYQIKCAGRSTRFILHNLGVFPCDGETCSRESQYFKATERAC